MDSDIAAGTAIGAYVLDEPIGRGGFATIWRGHHETSGQKVAVKVLNMGPGADRSLQRAEIELLAGAAVRRTTHAVQVLDGGIQPFPHLVMEFVEGTDFAEVLAREKRLSIERTIDVGLDVAEALSAMNRAGIIHRDLKPANVMLSNDGVVKLTDFGIAKIIGYETITVAGEIALTMAYAAPEVWDNGDGPYGMPGHRSDLYALAIMLFEFLTGATPFSGNYTALYRSHRERRPDLTKLPEGTPASLRLLLERCLEKDPGDRLRDADACTALLHRARVELQEIRGQRSPLEPTRFGPWERLQPHPTLPWAWLCRRETGENSTIELVFSDTPEAGTRLRRAVAANSGLTPHGAERLIETNRLLLRPGEEWTEPPPGQFQFWIARDEQPMPVPAADISRSDLGVIAATLQRLIASASAADVTLTFAPGDMTVSAGGRIQLRRPGIDASSTPMETAAMALLAKLPLDANARVMISVAAGLDALITPLSFALGDATQVVGRPSSDHTVVIDSTVTVCGGCGSRLLASDAFCGTCGRKNQPVGSTCPRCSTATSASDAFCGNCGQRLR